MTRPIKTRLDLDPVRSPSEISSSAEDPASTRGRAQHQQFHMGGRVNTDVSDMSPETTNQSEYGEGFGDLGSAARTNSDFDVWSSSPYAPGQYSNGSGGTATVGHKSFTVPRMNPLEVVSSPQGGDDDAVDPFAGLDDDVPDVPPPPAGGFQEYNPQTTGANSPGEDPFAGIGSTAPTPNRTHSEHQTTEVETTDAAEDWAGWYCASDGFWYKKEDHDMELDPSGVPAGSSPGDDEDVDDVLSTFIGSPSASTLNGTPTTQATATSQSNTPGTAKSQHQNQELQQINSQASSPAPLAQTQTPKDATPTAGQGVNRHSFASPQGNGSMASNSGSPTFRPPLREASGSMSKIRFKRIKELGRGAFGEVYLCMNILTGSLMAAKHIRLDDSTIGSKLVRDVQREINIMSSLPDHPNVVRYIGSQEGNKCMYIFMEVVSGGSVEGLLKATRQRFHEATIQQYAFMVLLGLQHLHLNNIVHQDVKGANVLIDNAGIAKIADFGCCKDLGAMHMNSSKTAGSPLFMAPEVCRGDPADTRSDIWSFGCFLLEMAKDDRKPWSGFGKDMSLFAIIYAISSAKEPPEVPTYLSPVCQDFIQLCLKIDPAQRGTTEQLLNHQFFEEDSIFDMDVLEQLHSEGDFMDLSPTRGVAAEHGKDSGSTSSTFVRSTLKVPQLHDSPSPLLGASAERPKSPGGRDFEEAEQTHLLYQFSLGSAKSTYNDAFTPVGLRSLKPASSTGNLGLMGMQTPQDYPTIAPTGEVPTIPQSTEQGPLLCHYSGGGTIGHGTNGPSNTPPPAAGPPASQSTGNPKDTRSQLALVTKVSGSANKRGGKKETKNTGALGALLNKFRCGM